jgi:hypothetical protein
VNRKQRAALEAARHAQTARMQAAAFRAANAQTNAVIDPDTAPQTNGDVWGWSR